MTIETTPLLDVKTAVREAVEELQPTGDKSTDKEKPGSKDDKTADDKKEAKPSKEDAEAEQVELANARQLYQALKDPEQRGAVIEFIAKQGGYVKNIETKADIKEAKDEIKEALTAALGPEFDFLTEKLGPALDKIIASKLKAGLAETEAALAEQEQEKLNGQSEKALGKLTKDFFGEGSELPDAVSKGMSAFMDKVPPQPDMSVADYLEFAFYSTIGKLGIIRKDSKTQDRIDKNKKDAPARLAAERTFTGKTAVDESKIMSRKDAIRAAIESLGEDND